MKNSNKNNPKLINLLLSVIVIMSIMSAGCQKTSEEKLPKKSVFFLHYYTFSGSFNFSFDNMVKAFNKQNAVYELKSVPLDHESFKTSIHDNLKAGNPADVYSCWSGARTEAIVDKLLPIDDLWERTGMGKRFPESVVKSACIYRGHKYLVPLAQHYIGFFYNKKTFADNNIEPPATWEEFLSVCEKLKANNIVPIALGSKAKWPAQFWFDYLLLRTASYEYRQKLMNGIASYTDPEVEKVFDMWRELIEKNYFNSSPNDISHSAGAGIMVRKGEAAMTLMGTWFAVYFSDKRIGWNDYGFFSFPVIDPQIPLCALGTIDGVIIPKDAKNIQGAKAVLEFLSDAEAQKMISLATGAVSANITVSDDFYTPFQKKVKAEIGKTKYWASNYDLSVPPREAEIGLDLFTEIIEFPNQYKALLQRAETRMKKR